VDREWLAETAPRWTAAVAPIAEQLAGDLFAARQKRTGRSSRALATPLTQANRSTGREGVRVRSRGSARPKNQAPPKTCVVCGADLKRGRSRYCESCREIQPKDAISKAHEVLRTRRRAGDDPAHGGEATRRRSKRSAANARANIAWERRQSGSFDPRIFERQIGPKLAAVSLSAMMRATGLSGPYCAMIRRGKCVPHPRHWNTLRALSS